MFGRFDVTQLSLLLSRLLTLGNGDIEANLLNFIYRQNLEDGIATKYSAEEELEVAPKVAISKKEEISQRNHNKEVAREEAELKGQLALSSEVERVSLLDNLDSFQVQKVIK